MCAELTNANARETASGSCEKRPWLLNDLVALRIGVYQTISPSLVGKYIANNGLRFTFNSNAPGKNALKHTTIDQRHTRKNSALLMLRQ